MTVKRIRAASGAMLSLISTKKFKSNYFALNFYLPLEKEAASQVSLLSRVMTRGTEEHPNIGALNRYTDMLYNLNFSLGVSAVGGAQVLTFRMDFLGDRFAPTSEKVDITEGALSFAKNFFCAPLVKDGSFLPEYVEAEKKLLIDKIRGEINNKDAYAARRGRRYLLGDHPAAIPPEGDIDTVSALDGKQLFERYRSMLRYARVEALFVGDVSEEIVEKVLATVKAILPLDRDEAEMPKMEKFAPISDQTAEITEEARARQGRMVLGYHLPYSGEESPVATTFIEIFSGSPVSRLFMNVRERLNLCYYCFAHADLAVGTMMIRSGISEKNVPLARDEISRQLQSIAAGEISEEEMEQAKISIISSLRTLTDSPASLGEWYIRRIVLGAPADIDEMMERVESVTVSDVAELAGRAKLCTAYFLRGTEE